MASRAVVLGVSLAALIDSASPLLAQEPAPRAALRLRVVQASDGTAVGGAEVFDLVVDPGSSGKLTWQLHHDPDGEMPKVARRCVAGSDGWVELAPGKLHSMLARAPGSYRFIELADLDRQNGGTLELMPDDPLVIQLVDVRGDPVEGAIVERQVPMFCGSGGRSNDPWRATSGRDGRVSLPHYWSRAADDFAPENCLELQNPMNSPPSVVVGRTSLLRDRPTVDESTLLVRWQLPPLSKIHVEFTGADTVLPDRAITFEMVGPKQYFGSPDRYASDHGKPVELLTETGVAMRACFHWREPEEKRWGEPDLRVFGSAHPIEGGCALLRVPVASDPVAVRVRPVHGDGSAFTGARKFDVSFQWLDRNGFRFRTYVGRVAPDETGTLRLSWQRPRIEVGDRPAKLRVALRAELHLYGWEPLEPDDLVSREVDWPVGETLDVGTIVLPGSV